MAEMQLLFVVLRAEEVEKHNLQVEVQGRTNANLSLGSTQQHKPVIFCNPIYKCYGFQSTCLPLPHA